MHGVSLGGVYGRAGNRLEAIVLLQRDADVKWDEGGQSVLID